MDRTWDFEPEEDDSTAEIPAGQPLEIDYGKENWGALRGETYTGMLSSQFDVNGSECNGLS